MTEDHQEESSRTWLSKATTKVFKENVNTGIISKKIQNE